jgi:hypothetical protein
MSGNLKIAQFSGGVLPYTIVSDSSITNDPIIDVTGSAGTVYDINLDLSSGINHNYYLKLWLQTASVTLGTTPPDIIIEADQDQIVRVNFPGGLYFSALSAALVDSNADNSVAMTTTNNSGTVKLTLTVS